MKSMKFPSRKKKRMFKQKEMPIILIQPLHSIYEYQIITLHHIDTHNGYASIKLVLD